MKKHLFAMCGFVALAVMLAFPVSVMAGDGSSAFASPYEGDILSIVAVRPIDGDIIAIAPMIANGLRSCLSIEERGIITPTPKAVAALNTDTMPGGASSAYSKNLV